jgi:hypothetical protein
MRPLHLRLALLAVAAGAASLVLGADGLGFYTNAQVVAVDMMGRTLVIRNAGGRDERVQLDDNLSGFGGIKAGDRVMLTLRRGPGWARVSSIVKSRAAAKPGTASKPGVAATSSSNRALAHVDDSPEVVSRRAFGAEMARLAEQADQVDRVWKDFRTGCDFRAGSPRDGAREWFVLWEGPLRADLSGGFCRDLFDQIVDLGEPIMAGMIAAEDVARPSLSPGEMREIRGRYTMDWDSATSPKLLER